MNTTTRRLQTVVCTLLLILLTGCGEGQNQNRLSGSVQIDGSSTVYPLTEAVAEEFMQEYPGVRVTVGVSGTGGGFSKFTRGTSDINDASRPIRPVEIERAESNNVRYVELPVAYDGIAIMANPANDWVECLTTEELEQIWEPDSDVQNWNDIRETFPDRPLSLYGPGSASGTFDYFTAAIMGEEGASRSQFTASEDDNVLIQGIAGDPGALGFTGMAYYYNNQDNLKLLGVDDGDPANGEGCVQARPETVRAGTYQPLSRPMFIYVSENSAQDEAVQAFVEFYLQNAGDLAPQVEYVGLSERAYELALQRFQNRQYGSMFEHGEPMTGMRIEDLLRQAQSDTTAAPADTAGAPVDTAGGI